jgi:ATP-dependent Clp protease ATP-binding subunit ClpX
VLLNFPFDDDDPVQAAREPSRQERENLREFIRALPLIAPPEIFERLEQLGYKGQPEPRRALALMAYRHVRRLKRLHVDDEPRRHVPPKQNTLLVGPTGSGKTFWSNRSFNSSFICRR